MNTRLEDNINFVVQNRSIALNHAQYYVKHGISVVPLLPSLPIPSIKQFGEFKYRLPTQRELWIWFTGSNSDSNIGIVCGEASGNLVAIKFSNAVVYTRFKSLLVKENIDIYSKLPSSWVASNGTEYVVFFRIDVDKNGFTTLVTSLPSDSNSGVNTVISGYVVAPPSTYRKSQYHFLEGVGPFGTAPNPEPKKIPIGNWWVIMAILERLRKEGW